MDSRWRWTERRACCRDTSSHRQVTSSSLVLGFAVCFFEKWMENQRKEQLLGTTPLANCDARKDETVTSPGCKETFGLLACYL